MDPIRARADFRLAPSPRPRPSDLEGGHGSPPRSAAEIWLVSICQNTKIHQKL